MKQLKWYFKNETAQKLYDIIYEDEKLIAVRNVESGKYSYGMRNCFGTLCGFPVGQSCLTPNEVIKNLTADLARSQKNWGETDLDFVVKERQAKNEIIKRLNA